MSRKSLVRVPPLPPYPSGDLRDRMAALGHRMLGWVKSAAHEGCVATDALERQPEASPAMTRAILLLLLLLPACQPEHRWFILAGQSNMVGNSDQPKVRVQAGTVLRGSPNLGTVFMESRIEDPLVWGGNVAGNANRSSMAPSFAEHTPWVDHLITAAISGTALAEDGGPNAYAWNPEVGDLYARMVTMWGLAGFPPIREVLWLQGESEAQYWHNRMLAEGRTSQWRYDNSYAAYKAALFDLADHVWADFGAPLRAAPINLRTCIEVADPIADPVCTTFVQPSWKLMGVHDATIDAAAEHPHILAGPIHDDVYSPNSTGHTWDVAELGRRWAEALAQ